MCQFVGLMTKLNYLVQKTKFMIFEVFYGAQGLQSRIHKIYLDHLLLVNIGLTYMKDGGLELFFIISFLC